MKERGLEHSTIDIVLPAHNEGEGIEGTLREFEKVVHEKGGQPVHFIVCEDGSTDNTVEILEKLGDDLPLTLISSTARKGYSQAAIDGLRAATSDLVGFIDADGQCDPSSFLSLCNAIDGVDLVVGYRNPRHDPSYRKLMSWAFKTVYERLFPVRLRDPSCPFVLVRRAALERILDGSPGLLKQGFWWEFNARAHSAGIKITQRPVHHRLRTEGVTKVYRIRRIPRIALDHLRALGALRQELRQKRATF